ncbi:pyridoxamine 5'-phosphate oxidase family protein [Rothia sp. ZJ932]|uniref:pyridoxamine 5'-phosphate oxidase family protein n=1 Tax=Rothia sp. ZJ932 TaxID=2810516 RepID=UPI0019670348|nr:pyridoxamine 5'-phosphate oxidase family protein [Rothia sp. ZJ932]QRZ61976.1 pyridoxamine 5'-phosphate oxidase family protein [Rothia sp. ZJ932]
MTEHDSLHPLTEDECWQLLGNHRVGRVAVVNGTVIDIYPVSYAVAHRKIYFRTTDGEKFSSVMVTRNVSFEVDETAETSKRWVTLAGYAHWLSEGSETLRADALHLDLLAPTSESHWVEIEPTDMNGTHMFMAPYRRLEGAPDASAH